MDKFSVGIDFGTSNIKCAIYNEMKKESEPINLLKNQTDNVLANIVDIKEKNVLVGKPKIRNKIKSTVVRNIKRHIEEENWRVFVEARNRYMNAVEIASETFGWIKDEIEKKMHKTITSAAITVPVCYSEIQKNRIRRAAMNAGIAVDDIISEPTAALFSDPFLDQIEKPTNFFIFDFGGGTLDMSVFNVKPAEQKKCIEVLAASGIRFGGVDITNLICDELIIKKHEKEISDEIDSMFKRDFLSDNAIPDCDKIPVSYTYVKTKEEIERKVINSLFDFANDAKESVFESGDDYCDSYITSNDESFEIVISYDDIIKTLKKVSIDKTIKENIDNLMEISMIDCSDIDHIMMVGGSAKIDYFRNILIEAFDGSDEKVSKLDNRMKYNAVAVGADNYIRNKDEKYIVINRIAYEIGVMESGAYERYMDYNTGYGDVPTLRKPVVIEESEDGLKFKLYQVFADSKMRKIDISKEVIYMGCFMLDNSKYDISKNYLVELQIEADGSISGLMYDNSGVIIEKLILTVEG